MSITPSVRMRALRSVGCLAVALTAQLIGAASLAAHQPPRRPDAQTCGQPGNPCPSVAIANTFTAVTRAPESGPYTYTITVQNQLATTSSMRVLCIALAAQLPCTTPSPSLFALASGATRIVTPCSGTHCAW